MHAMMPVIPRSGSRKVNGYVKAVLALEAVRRKREARYERVVRPLDRKRDALTVEVATRLRALSGGQRAAAQRLLALIVQATVDGGPEAVCAVPRGSSGGGVWGWGRDGLGTGARGRGARARRALLVDYALGGWGRRRRVGSSPGVCRTRGVRPELRQFAHGRMLATTRLFRLGRGNMPT